MQGDIMPDEMFFSDDMKSLRRGRRVAQRTPVCRPCMVWRKDAPEDKFQGVVMDVSPYGMLVRMLECFEAGTRLSVQMMRDDTFTEALAAPHEGLVVRAVQDDGGFVNHGVQLMHERRAKAKGRTARPEPKKRPAKRRAARMHTIDYTVGNR